MGKLSRNRGLGTFTLFIYDPAFTPLNAHWFSAAPMGWKCKKFHGISSELQQLCYRKETWLENGLLWAKNYVIPSLDWEPALYFPCRDNPLILIGWSGVKIQNVQLLREQSCQQQLFPTQSPFMKRRNCFSIGFVFFLKRERWAQWTNWNFKLESFLIHLLFIIISFPFQWDCRYSGVLQFFLFF